MILTHEELVELTDRQQPARQVKWLIAHGWHFEVSATGRPKVSRKYAESKLGAAQQTVEPDFTFIKKVA